MGTIIQPADGDPRHGTLNGYHNLQCGRQPDGSRRSCYRCREANAINQARYMRANPKQQEKHRQRMAAYRARKRQEFGTPYEQLPGA